MGFIWTSIIGDIIGAITGAITSKGSSMGIVASITAGLVGSAVGQALLETWGPTIARMAIVPSLIGAIILVLVVSFFARKL